MSFLATAPYHFAVNGFKRSLFLLLHLLGCRRPDTRKRAAAFIAARNPSDASHQENLS